MNVFYFFPGKTAQIAAAVVKQPNQLVMVKNMV